MSKNQNNNAGMDSKYFREASVYNIYIYIYVYIYIYTYMCVCNNYIHL